MANAIALPAGVSGQIQAPNKIMRITTRTLDALQLLGEIWRLDGRPYSLGRASSHYLEQIAVKLRRQGVLSSRMGAGGGYTLSRPADQIALADVIRAVESDRHQLTPEQRKMADVLRSLLGPDVVMLADVIRRLDLQVIPPPPPPAPKGEPKFLNPNPPDVTGVARSVFDLGRGMR